MPIFCFSPLPHIRGKKEKKNRFVLSERFHQKQGEIGLPWGNKASFIKGNSDLYEEKGRAWLRLTTVSPQQLSKESHEFAIEGCDKTAVTEEEGMNALMQSKSSHDSW